MVKSILSKVAAAALIICSYTSAAGTPDDADDSALTLLRKSTSTRNLKDNAEVASNLDPLAMCEQMMKSQGVDSENIASPAMKNPGTITLNVDGGMTISGYVKLTADIEVPGELPSGVAITLVDGAVLDCAGHSITGRALSETGGIKVVGGGGTQIKNCDVSAFTVGANVSGGEDVSIESSSFRANGETGIFGSGGTTKMNDVTAVDNVFGIALINGENIELKKIVANRNVATGVTVNGSNAAILVLEDIIAEQNGNDGVDHSGSGFTLNGKKNSFSNNVGNGLVIKGSAASTVSIDGKVIVNNNKDVGIIVETDADFMLAKKGSLEACNNDNYDWEVNADATFTGKKYTCDAGKINGDGPACKPCK